VDIETIEMELEMQENKYKNKKKDVDRLSKILEEVIQLSNSTTPMGEKEILKLVKHYEEQINDKSNE
jgi:hypothetical protein